MADPEKMVTYDSPEAASIKTVTGWVSRGGCFWGDDEHMARFDGCTHIECAKCGSMNAKRSYCELCYERAEIKKYEEMPRKEWDGSSMIYSLALDEYFDDLEAALDERDTESMSEVEACEKLMLVQCEPNRVRELEINEYCRDELSEDGEVTFADVLDAVDALNAAIRKMAPLSWRPGKIAITVNSGTGQQCAGVTPTSVPRAAESPGARSRTNRHRRDHP